MDEAIAAGVGAAFGIELRTKEGEVPTGDALKKLASQKQSQISSWPNRATSIWLPA
ncbi:hypothetical protein [Stenotrophomonas phage CM2]